MTFETPRQQLEAAIGEKDLPNWWLSPNGTGYGHHRSAPQLVVIFDPTSPDYYRPWYAPGPKGSEWYPSAQEAVEAVRGRLDLRP